MPYVAAAKLRRNVDRCYLIQRYTLYMQFDGNNYTGNFATTLNYTCDVYCYNTYSVSTPAVASTASPQGLKPTGN